MSQMLYQSLNQRWSANRGCVLMSVFSSKPSMQMHYFRVEYGSCERHEKSHLALPSVRTLRQRPRARVELSGFNSSLLTATTLLYTNFCCVKKFFSNKLIICDFFRRFWSTKQSFSLCVHHRILCFTKDTLGVPDVKRV